MRYQMSRSPKNVRYQVCVCVASVCVCGCVWSKCVCVAWLKCVWGVPSVCFGKLKKHYFDFFCLLQFFGNTAPTSVFWETKKSYFEFFKILSTSVFRESSSYQGFLGYPKWQPLGRRPFWNQIL